MKLTLTTAHVILELKGVAVYMNLYVKGIMWFKDHGLHRKHGPAVRYILEDYEEWHFNDEEYTEEEHKELTK